MTVKTSVTKNTKDFVSSRGYKILKTYNKKKDKRAILIDNIGYRYDVSLSNFKNGHIPRPVDKKNPFSLQNIKLWIKLNNKSYRLNRKNKYGGEDSKLSFHCFMCNETFYTSWSKIRIGQSCGVCDGAQAGKRTSLKYLRADLAKEWNYEKNSLKPENVTCGSGKDVWWKCKKCKHEWKDRISHRTLQNCNCPACSGKIVTDRNSLSVLFPKLAMEWHPSKNKNLKPEDFSYGSEEKVWWLCPRCGHDWDAIINSRSSGVGCPLCSIKRGESKIVNALKEYCSKNYSSISEYKKVRNPKTGCYLPFDIFIPTNNVFIEVHWNHHYEIVKFHELQARKRGTTAKEEFENQKYRDRIKRKYARKNGVYIEIDLRKSKTVEKAIAYIENSISKSI
jgi:DNA-directed RNA polymerase subunit RPC12/RpoP